MALRVILGEDSYIVRQGIVEILSEVPEIDLVAACGNESSLVQAIEKEQPDVVITDIRMPPSNTNEGIRIAARLRETHPDAGVVVLSQYTDPPYALALLESGSEGRAYLLKERVRD
ncbi:MAG: response regulator, partial [Solirubrobacterales bacterium]